MEEVKDQVKEENIDNVLSSVNDEYLSKKKRIKKKDLPMSEESKILALNSFTGVQLSWLERLHDTQKVADSTSATPTIPFCAAIVQWQDPTLPKW